MSWDCSSRKDYSQELPGFNLKRLEKCPIEKHQPHQPKLVAVETVDPNKTWPKLKNSTQFQDIVTLPSYNNYNLKSFS